MTRALVIAHEPDGPACQIEVRLRQRGIDVHTHVVTRSYDEPDVAAPFPGLDDYDLLVPMGSVRSLTRKLEISSWIHDELDLIRIAHAARMPILGVCFGGQLIADALGGRVEAAPEMEMGWYEIREAFPGSNPVGPGPWLEWHHDRCFPPDDADVLAVTDGAIQLFRLDASVGTQFHPEVDVDHVRGWLAAATDEYLSECGTDRHRVLEAMRHHEAANTVRCHALVDWFLDDVAALGQR